MKKSDRSIFWNTMVDILDGQFPKGQCYERGRAIVMVSYIDMMLRGFEFDEFGQPKIDKVNKVVEGKKVQKRWCSNCKQFRVVSVEKK
jgi:hypothetical protein